jgi:hypothetical protein
MIQEFLEPHRRYNDNRVALLLSNNTDAAHSIIQRVHKATGLGIGARDSALPERALYLGHPDRPQLKVRARVMREENL